MVINLSIVVKLRILNYYKKEKNSAVKKKIDFSSWKSMMNM